MLDQNTDRMWYVIGALVVGAGIIIVANIFMPETVESILMSMSDTADAGVAAASKLGVLGTVVEGNHKEEAIAVYEDWASKYLVPLGNQMIVNSSDNAGTFTATSESHGYGMLMTALQPSSEVNKERFDKLYAYYLANRGHGTQLMAWQQTYTSGGALTSNDENNATDGDIFIAEALYIASKTYPENAEAYLEQAKLLMADMLDYNYNPDANILVVSNWADDNTKEWTVFRSSDVVPAFFSDFQKVSGDSRWGSVSNAMTNYMLDVSKSNQSGLVPDFIDVKSGTGVPVDYNVMWDPEATYYGWSAIRVPFLLGISTSGTGRQVLTRMTNFLNNEDPLYALYYLDGSPAANYSSVATLEPLNYANKQLSKEDTLTYQLPNGGYYADTVYALTRILN